MYHQSQGRYKLAVANYKETGGFLVANGNMKKCYYHIGVKKEKKGIGNAGNYCSNVSGNDRSFDTCVSDYICTGVFEV